MTYYSYVYTIEKEKKEIYGGHLYYCGPGKLLKSVGTEALEEDEYMFVALQLRQNGRQFEMDGVEPESINSKDICLSLEEAERILEAK
jgi:hypothetical protein